MGCPSCCHTPTFSLWLQMKWWRWQNIGELSGFSHLHLRCMLQWSPLITAQDSVKTGSFSRNPSRYSPKKACRVIMCALCPLVICFPSRICFIVAGPYSSDSCQQKSIPPPSMLYYFSHISLYRLLYFSDFIFLNALKKIMEVLGRFRTLLKKTYVHYA